MAVTLLIDFDYELNTSLQIGDEVYHTLVSSLGGFNQDGTNVTTHIGVINDIINNVQNPNLPLFQIQVVSQHIDPANNTLLPGVLPGINSFLSFSKDKTVNDNDLLGYYASINFQNDSKTKAELFSVGANVVESSK
tara:strand:+ start:1144 stop:1551 length:408 start_codon:yes stop_codon:yes gene_type:complete